MLRFTRILATRLHRCAAPARRALGVGQGRGDAWSRLELAVTALTPSAEALRRRELSQENVRLAVTLIGQQGARVIDRVMLACEGDLGLTPAPSDFCSPSHGRWVTRRRVRQQRVRWRLRR